jgi:hypothetical protein
MTATKNEITNCPHCGSPVTDSGYDGRRVKMCVNKRCMCSWNIHGGSMYTPVDGDRAEVTEEDVENYFLDAARQERELEKVRTEN